MESIRYISKDCYWVNTISDFWLDLREKIRRINPYSASIKDNHAWTGIVSIILMHPETYLADLEHLGLSRVLLARLE